MAITKSAKKAIRQSARRKEQNIVYKDKIKILVKEVRVLVLAKKLAEAKKLDKKGMMRDQIKQMQAQLQGAPSKNQMRMAQMMGGRKKTPKMR
jgi:ribosomal protein S20